MEPLGHELLQENGKVGSSGRVLIRWELDEDCALLIDRYGSIILAHFKPIATETGVSAPLSPEGRDRSEENLVD